MADFFHYVTYKYVILKDRRLGVAYYILALLILIYTVIEIFYRKGYLQFDTKPQGVIRALVSDELSNSSFDPNKLVYCIDIAQHNLTCRYEDPRELNWPVEGRAVTITTFVKDRVQKSHLQTNSPQDEYDSVSDDHYFTLGSEYVIMKVDHAVVASLFTDHKGIEKLAASKRMMKGYLLNHNGDVIKELSVPGKPDKITLQEILQAGGVSSLDEKSDAVNAKGQTIRQRGAILRVSIHYQNWYNTWFGTSEIEYSYRVHRIPYMDYNIKQTLHYTPSSHVENTKWRLLRKRYSVRLEFEQDGSLGMFSTSTLLLKLVSGTALLTLTATIIDVIALYLLPNKEVYRKHVYEQTREINKKMD